jgi:hypothetical protein
LIFARVPLIIYLRCKKYNHKEAGPVPDPKPSVKQVYLLARLLCEQADVKFPESVTEASDTIGELIKQKDEAKA